MVAEAKILNSLREPPQSRFVGRETKDKRRAFVITELGTTDRMRVYADQIRGTERAFLDDVATNHKTLDSFFNDPRISPTPETNLDLTPYMSHDVMKFTISCLAPKAQNPNKSDKVLPDLGELGLLIHFEELAELAERKYGKPVEFTLLTEGHYAQELLGYDPELVRAFNDRLQDLSQNVVEAKHVKLRDKYDAVSSLPGYEKEYDFQRQLIVDQLETNPDFEKEFLSIIPTVYSYIKPADFAHTDAIYDLDMHENATKQHMQNATEKTINLMAFYHVRSALGERPHLFPDYIYGSMTPAEGKFGFYALGPWNERYPNHGIGVLDTETGRVHVRYRRNIDPTFATSYHRATTV